MGIYIENYENIINDQQQNKRLDFMLILRPTLLDNLFLNNPTHLLSLEDHFIYIFFIEECSAVPPKDQTNTKSP